MQRFGIALIGLLLVTLVRPAELPAQAAPTVEAVVARDLVDRMPVDSATTFSADVGQVYCWTRITGAEGTTIQHVWIHGENEFPVALDIGGSPWRTWSSKNIPAEWTGAWRVEIRDAAGTVLKTLEFTVGS